MKISGYFDKAFYYTNYPDVKNSGIPAIKHYLLYGAGEGRNPSPDFDTRYYVDKNQDIKESGINPLIHYIRYGKKEKRPPSPAHERKGETEMTDGLKDYDQIPKIRIYTQIIKFPTDLNTYRFQPSGKKEFINEYFSHIYLVNLKCRKDRLQRMFDLLKQLHISLEVVEAVNGNESPHTDEYEYYKSLPVGSDTDHMLERVLNRRIMQWPGVWGHLKTFRYILKDAEKKKYRRILVLEDDVLFMRDFHRKFSDFIQVLGNRSWKVLQLGSAQMEWNTPHNLIYPDPMIQQPGSGQSFYYPVTSMSTFAVGFDRSVYKEGIRLAEEMNCSFDRALNVLYQKYLYQCFVAYPNLIISDISDSNISNVKNRSNDKFRLKQRWNIDLYDTDNNISQYQNH